MGKKRDGEIVQFVPKSAATPPEVIHGLEVHQLTVMVVRGPEHIAVLHLDGERDNSMNAEFASITKAALTAAHNLLLDREMSDDDQA